MDVASELRTLRAVAAHLPFDVDDTARAGEAFVRWRQDALDEDRQVVELWTYCYVRLYFIQKFIRRDDCPFSDFDDLVEKAYRRAQQGSRTVEEPARYPGWVSVICRNTYINYVRGPRPMLPLHEEADQFLVAEPSPPPLVDGSRMQRAMGDAVDRLPESLRPVARLRFLEKLSYEEISRLTGKSLPVIRSAASKALARFREDVRLRSALEKATDNVLAT